MICTDLSFHNGKNADKISNWDQNEGSFGHFNWTSVVYGFKFCKSDKTWRQFSKLKIGLCGIGLYQSAMVATTVLPTFMHKNITWPHYEDDWEANLGVWKSSDI